MDTVFFYALLCSLSWAIIAISHRHFMTSVNIITAFTIAAVAMFATMLVILPFNYKTITHDLKTHTRTIALHTIVYITIYIAIGQFLYYYTINNTHNLNYVMPILYTTPLFAVILGYFLLKENVTLGGIVGCLLIVIGSSVIAITGNKK